MLRYRQLKKRAHEQKEKNMKAQVMRRAWELAKAGAAVYGGPVKMYFAEALRMAWKEAKGNTKEQMIEALEKVGFKRWQKAGYDRLYIDASHLGLVCDYYNTGNICKAEFNGERISNSKGRQLKAAKTFIDVRTWTVYSTNEDLKEAAKKLAKIA
jgi:hypothetical protein